VHWKLAVPLYSVNLLGAVLCCNAVIFNVVVASSCDVNFSDVEGTVPEDHHDRHADSPAVVHLRRRQGLLPSAASTATRDAGVSEEEAGGCPSSSPRLQSLRLLSHPGSE